MGFILTAHPSMAILRENALPAISLSTWLGLLPISSYDLSTNGTDVIVDLLLYHQL